MDLGLPDVNIGPHALAANWLEASIATVVVSVRIYTQYFVVGNVGVDDYLVVLSLITGLINTSLISRAIYHGIGRHIYYLTDAQITNAGKYEILAQPWGVISPTLSRVSFAIFLLRFVGHRKTIKWLLWSIIILQLVTNLTTTIQILVQCKNIASLWDKTVEGYCMPRNVQVIFGYTQGGFNCVHDLMLTFSPIAILKDLNMQMRVKIVLIVLMGMSIFGFCASIVKTVMLGSLGKRMDFTYDTIPLIIWFTIENYITIIAASIPSLRPLFLSIKRRGTSNSNSHNFKLNRTAGNRPSVGGYLKQASSHNNMNNSTTWQPDGDHQRFSGRLNPHCTVRTEVYKYPIDADASSEENILVGVTGYGVRSGGNDSSGHHGGSGNGGIKKSVSVNVQYSGVDGV